MMNLKADKDTFSSIIYPGVLSSAEVNNLVGLSNPLITSSVCEFGWKIPFASVGFRINVQYFLFSIFQKKTRSH